VKVVAIFPTVTATTPRPRDCQHLTRRISLVCNDAVTILGHGTCQDVGQIQKRATELSVRKGREVMAGAWAQTAHPAETIVGITDCLCNQSIKAFAAIVVRNALNIRGKQLLLLYRHTIQSANNFNKR